MGKVKQISFQFFLCCLLEILVRQIHHIKFIHQILGWLKCFAIFSYMLVRGTYIIWVQISFITWVKQFKFHVSHKWSSLNFMYNMREAVQISFITCVKQFKFHSSHEWSSSNFIYHMREAVQISCITCVKQFKFPVSHVWSSSNFIHHMSEAVQISFITCVKQFKFHLSHVWSSSNFKYHEYEAVEAMEGTLVIGSIVVVGAQMWCALFTRLKAAQTNMQHSLIQ